RGDRTPRRTRPSRTTRPSTARSTGTALRRRSHARILGRLISGRVAILLGRVLVARGAFRQQRRRVKGSVLAHATFDDDVDAVGERVWREPAIQHGNDARPIRDVKGVFPAAGGSM